MVSLSFWLGRSVRVVVGLARSTGGRLASEGIFGSLPISLALLPAISRLPLPLPPSLSLSQVHRGRHQVRSKMRRACAGGRAARAGRHRGLLRVARELTRLRARLPLNN